MLFHPFEIGFAGFSNTGKTTFITHLISELKTKYRIGYIKHASCGFSLDTPGKDSDLVYKSGATQIRYALKAEVNGAKLTRFVSKEDWDKIPG